MRFHERGVAQGGGGCVGVDQALTGHEGGGGGAQRSDSDMLSIIDGEWPQRDAELRAWLAAENFDEEGRQIKRLEAFRL